MKKFIRVRMVQANAMDLSLFQFDFDLTFAAFFLNSDRTIYGRFGTRSSAKDAMHDISLEGFHKALAAALKLHERYPANRASLRGKSGPKGPALRFTAPEQYPSLRRFQPTIDFAGKVSRSCIHCHMVRAAERKELRAARKPIPDKVLYPWPMPDVLGLTLDPQEKAKVSRVARGSAAEKAGFRPSDEILILAGQPIISIADVQWVLHNTDGPAKLEATVRRGWWRKVKISLSLPAGWRRQSDISWRTSTWDLRRMATGGLVLEALPAAERRNRGLAAERLALRVKHVGQYGAHAAGKRAGFKRGDIIVVFDGQTDRMTETDLLAHVLQKRPRGTRIPVTVLRASKRVELKLPTQ